MKLKYLVKLMAYGTHFVIEQDFFFYHFYDPSDILDNPDHADKLEKDIVEVWHSPHVYQTMVIKITK